MLLILKSDPQEPKAVYETATPPTKLLYTSKETQPIFAATKQKTCKQEIRTIQPYVDKT